MTSAKHGERPVMTARSLQTAGWALHGMALGSAMLLISAVSPVAAADSVGKVLLSTGQTQARAADGTVRSLARRDVVVADDTLETAADSQLQVRMIDNAIIALTPESVFQLKSYQFNAQRPQDGQAFMELVKGGMRTLSGQIGKSDPASYQLETPVASIGIRGTHYQLLYCDLRCARDFNSQEGLAGGVYSGAIGIRPHGANSQEQVVSSPHFFFIDRHTGRLTLLDTPPPMLRGLVPAGDVSAEVQRMLDTGVLPVRGDHLSQPEVLSKEPCDRCSGSGNSNTSSSETPVAD